MTRIAVITGSRAEYGLLCCLMREIQDDPDLTLQVIATGMHLSPEYGLTYRVIQDDGFQIDAKVEMLLSSDSVVGTAKSMGLGVIGFADAFDRLQPDLAIVLGDRFEILAATQAALVAKIPVAHIAGGDVTEGAFDEAIRHSISKMSHLHFTTNQVAADRLARMGESPEFVFNVGSPGLDMIRETELMTREAFESFIGFTLRSANLLITYHPVTLEDMCGEEQFQSFLDALDTLDSCTGLIFTKANADPLGRRINQMIDTFVADRDHAVARTSLGQRGYYSAIRHVDALVGNSSSGLYEAPSFDTPTVNIGDRQKGRLRATSVFDCEVGDLCRTVNRVLGMTFNDVENPYGDGHSAGRIMKVIKGVTDFRSLLKKRFYEE